MTFLIIAVIAWVAIIFALAYFLDWFGYKCCSKINRWISSGPDSRVAFVLGSISALIIGFVSITLYIPYTISDGQRTGKLMKFSSKGLIFKTYEGTLIVGVDRQWRFSVIDEVLAKKLKTLQGKDITIEYNQQLHVPSTMGSTNYIAISSLKLE